MANVKWTIDEIEDAETDLEGKIDTWLRVHGWQHTSETPGCIWMWQHEWKGQTLLVSQSTARHIQAEWDHEAQDREEPHVD